MSAITRDICELARNRRSPEAVLGSLMNKDKAASSAAGRALLEECSSYGLGVTDYLTLAIDPRLSAEAAKFEGLDGLESSFAYLGLPVRNDFKNGVVLQAAANTFQTYDGTRAMFPPVIDQMLRWQNRINQIETTESLVANSRSISGNELISVVVNDDSAARTTNTVSELANIPVKTVRTAEQSVKLYKHGSGYQFSYEFNRRANLDVLTPFAARVARQLELSKVAAATSILINGDGVQAAAVVQKSSDFAHSAWSYTHNGSLNYKVLLNWIVDRARRGVPVDTIVGNYAAYVDFLLLFTPVLNGQVSEAAALAGQGLGPKLQVDLPMVNQPVTFALASGVPDGQVIGLTKAETLEELVEAGSSIVESERAILNQSVTYVRSEVTGYKLIFADTREILDFGQ